MLLRRFGIVCQSNARIGVCLSPNQNLVINDPGRQRRPTEQRKSFRQRQHLLQHGHRHRGRWDLEIGFSRSRGHFLLSCLPRGRVRLNRNSPTTTTRSNWIGGPIGGPRAGLSSAIGPRVSVDTCATSSQGATLAWWIGICGSSSTKVSR